MGDLWFEWKYYREKINKEVFNKLPLVKRWSGDGKRIVECRLYKVGRKWATCFNTELYGIKIEKEALL